MATKRPLKTSVELYNRMRWDPAIPAERVVIGYEDHQIGMREVPLMEFTPGGRIPWSRVWYFRLDGIRLWDRKTRIDRLFGSGETAPDQLLTTTAVAPRRTIEGLSSIPIYRYSGTSWKVHPAASVGERLPETLRVGTLNVLIDDHLTAQIKTPQRVRAILEHLRRADLDLIVLQEVQPPVLKALLDTSWVQARYFVSDGPDAKTVHPYGQVILSRQAPLRLLHLRLSPRKRIIFALFDSRDRPLEVAAIHLTSDRKPDAPAIRATQLRQLLAALAPEADHLVVGDFNFDDRHHEPLLDDFVDLWPSLRPDDPGATFDPSRNPLAALMSQQQIPRRLDRLLLRAPLERLLAESIERFADTPIAGTGGGLFPSDHFGVVAQLKLNAARQALALAPTTHRTALAIVPPLGAWPTIQALRRAHDPRFYRWMPHITLLYGFIPPAMLSEAADVISEMLARMKGFTLTLSHVDEFSLPDERVLYLAPDRAGQRKLVALQQSMKQLFPQCTEQDRGERFTPHLTLARIPGDIEEPLGMDAVAPIAFPVEEVALMAREATGPFEVRYAVPFDGGLIEVNPRSPAADLAGALAEQGISAIRAPHRQAAMRAVQEAAELLTNVGIYPIGSTRLGVDGPDSDLDILMVGHSPRRTALAALLAALDDVEMARMVEDARAPVLKLRLRGTDIDLLYARYPADQPLRSPERVPLAALDALDPRSRQAINGSLEAQSLLNHVHNAPERWRTALRGLRSWAAARQLDAHAAGYPSGVAWAIIAAVAPDANTPEHRLERIFEMLVEWDWSEPIALGTGVIPHSDDPMQIMTSVRPRINSARNVTASTRATLKREMERALEQIWKIREGTARWSDLFTPADPESDPARLDLSLHTQNPVSMAEGQGWLSGRLLGLLITLERRIGLPLRPYARFRPVGRGLQRLTIGLPTPPQGDDRRRIQEALEDLEGQFDAWSGCPADLRLVSGLRWRASR
ncbi:MAG: poly(A) polymerase [Myxococcota bacterium]